MRVNFSNLYNVCRVSHAAGRNAVEITRQTLPFRGELSAPLPKLPQSPACWCFCDGSVRLEVSSVFHRGEQTDQWFFELAASLANRSAFRRSKFLRSAICSFSYSVCGLSDERNALLASSSRLLMT